MSCAALSPPTDFGDSSAARTGTRCDPFPLKNVTEMHARSQISVILFRDGIIYLMVRRLGCCEAVELMFSRAHSLVRYIALLPGVLLMQTTQSTWSTCSSSLRRPNGESSSPLGELADSASSNIQGTASTMGIAVCRNAHITRWQTNGLADCHDPQHSHKSVSCAFHRFD